MFSILWILSILVSNTIINNWLSYKYNLVWVSITLVNNTVKCWIEHYHVKITNVLIYYIFYIPIVFSKFFIYKT